MKRKLIVMALLAMLISLSMGGAKAVSPGVVAQSSRHVTAIASGPMSPVGSGFTYQGRLLDGGSPANGTYDLRFTLFDALSGGTQVGSPVTLSSQTVTNGLFTVTLDFGSTVFRGQARFMQIEVQHNGGGFVLLSPRQPLTPAPYAMSLMPGAVITDTTTNNVLTASNGGAGDGLHGVSTGGIGVEGGSTSGSGVAAFSSSNSSGAVSADNFAAGPGVFAVSSTGTGVKGASTGGSGVAGSSSSGYGGIFTSTTASGVFATGTNGVFANGTAPNGAGLWGNANNGSSAAGVYGTSTSGYGAWGLSTAASGAGVQGQTTVSGGTGVEAQGNGSGTTALAINNGAIKVTGAGDGTQTAVFVQTVHTGTGGNTCQSDFVTVLDNPYANGDPNAILLVTPSYPDSNGIFPHSVTAQYRLAASSGCPANRWALITTTSEMFANGEKYNVMVIKP